MNDLISIIIPVYNAESYLKRCLLSVINQTYYNLEIIIINDGSTDNSYNICKQFEEVDNRLIVKDCKNGGVSRARNEGLSIASGKYVLFIDSDDYIEENMVLILYNHIISDDGIDIVVCDVEANDQSSVTELMSKNKFIRIQDEEVIIINKNDLMYNLFNRNSIKGYLVNKLFKMSIIKDNRLLLDESIYICEDLLFCFHYFQSINQLIYINKMLYHYQVNENSLTHNKINSKRLSVLDAYNSILKEIDSFDMKTKKIIEINYRIHCLRMLKLIYEDKSGEYKPLVKNIKSELYQRKLLVFNKYFPIKYKLSYLFFGLYHIR